MICNKEHNKIKELFDLKQYKNWEPSYLDSDESKTQIKRKIQEIIRSNFYDAKIINFQK